MTELATGKVVEARTSEPGLDLLVEAHLPWVQRMCAALTGNTLEGQELTQEVMVSASRHFASIRDPEAFRPWLREVARNKLADWLRNKRSEQGALATVAERLSPGPPPHEDRIDLHSAIAILPLEQRAALTLHYFLGLRYREIAQAMRCPVGTVMSRLAAARAKLKRALVDPSDGGN